MKAAFSGLKLHNALGGEDPEDTTTILTFVCDPILPGKVEKGTNTGNAIIFKLHSCSSKVRFLVSNHGPLVAVNANWDLARQMFVARARLEMRSPKDCVGTLPQGYIRNVPLPRVPVHQELRYIKYIQYLISTRNHN
jgi:hypothetical protein